MKIAVGYVRMSTAKQALSPAVQCAAIERWAETEGYALVAVYFDLATCGAVEIADRPGLAAVLGDLRAHGAEALVVAKRDRFARDVGVAAEVERLAGKAGARTYAADGTGNGDDDGSALLRDISACLSAHERRLVRRRTRDALALKKARGERTGCVPFGKQLSADGVHLEPCPSEAATIERCLSLYLQGKSIRGIVAVLAGEGVVGRTGRPLAMKQIHRILQALAA